MEYEREQNGGKNLEMCVRCDYNVLTWRKSTDQFLETFIDINYFYWILQK